MEEIKAKRGRKPIGDQKKQLLGVYLKQHEISLLGGKEQVKQLIAEHLKQIINERSQS